MLSQLVTTTKDVSVTKLEVENRTVLKTILIQSPNQILSQVHRQILNLIPSLSLTSGRLTKLLKKFEQALTFPQLNLPEPAIKWTVQ